MIRYRFHFLILVVAAFVFWLAKESDFAYYELMGALHATAVVVSLRNRKAHHAMLALCFIVLAAAWSAATPVIAYRSLALWSLFPQAPNGGGLAYILMWVAGSAVGSAGYWLLVRLFWLRSLGRADCLRTVALCVAATLLSFPVAMLDQSGKDHYATVLFTVAWWLAFSLSLYWSEVSGQAKKSTPAIATVS